MYIWTPDNRIIQMHMADSRPIGLPMIQQYLYRRTGGMIGSLSQLVRGAAILAIDDGTEQITRALLDTIPVDYAAERANPPPRPRSTPKAAKPGATA